MQISLNGEWAFRQVHTEAWKPATVPGCNYLDLLRLGEIPDPFVGTNESEVYWVAKADWEYRKEFSVPEEMLAFPRVDLVCDCLDTVCDVFLNGRQIGHCENAHIRHSFSVRDDLQKENVLTFRFASPVNYVAEKQAVERCPRNNNGQDGIPHIRKPQCHFGWDWGPVLPPSGISGNIALRGSAHARLSDFQCTQQHEAQSVLLTVSTETERLDETEIVQRVYVCAPNGACLLDETKPLYGTTTVETLRIEHPQLWWTRDLSSCATQPLYTVGVSLLTPEGAVLDATERKIGLRTIVLNRGRDEYGENFQFVLNGVPLFIKGANWIPPDSFMPRYTEERLERDLQAVKFSNMNMLRIWGGGYYESDALYEKCDRDGILVWQDFCFACQPYPFFDDALLENVHREVIDNVKRLRHHACLALWNGNNEIETMSIAWRNRRNYMAWTEKFFYHILPAWLQSLDTQTPYIPGSPCGTAYMQGYDRDNVGDTHLWAVWHGLQPLTYYRKRMTRFCSEFGFESLPDLKTIQTFAKPEDYSLTGKVFSAHQKCNSGNMKMAYYIVSRFRLPARFEDYIYLSQICQEECVRDATEHWRRHRGRCNGSMYWQLNDCWPVCSWASMDYYGNYKALQYCARHFNAPVTVSLEDSKDAVRVFVLNDTTTAYSQYRIECRLLDFDGRELYTLCIPTDLPALQSTCVQTISMDTLKQNCDLHRAVLSVTLSDETGAEVAARTLLFAPEKRLSLPKTAIDMSVTVRDGVATLTLLSKCYQRFVQVYSAKNTQPFSDNYFDLLPNTPKIITQPVASEITEADVRADISFFSAGDVQPQGTCFSDFLTKAGVFLRPINFGSYIYDHRVPKDLRLK